MNLRTYLDSHKIGPAEFAASILVSAAALHRYLSGDRIPRPGVLERIVMRTGGEVQPNDFFVFAGNQLPVATGTAGVSQAVDAGIAQGSATQSREAA